MNYEVVKMHSVLRQFRMLRTSEDVPSEKCFCNFIFRSFVMILFLNLILSVVFALLGGWDICLLSWLQVL